MRVGVNPIRYEEFKGWPKILGVVITHLPNRSGYHSARQGLVWACCKSMRDHAGQDLPLLVWDNGSDAAFRNLLEKSIKPDYLIETPNIGKPLARASVLGMLPPDTVVCMSDDDMLFYPNWLGPQLELLNGFPNVGMVSGWPVRFSFGWAIDATVKYAKEHGNVEEGRFISDEQEIDYAESVGMNGADWLRTSQGKRDFKITVNGLSAYAEAQHCQWVGCAGRLADLARIPRAPRHSEIDFDKSIDALGMLRLTTIKRVCRHMGNRKDPKLEKELEEYHLL